MKEWSDAHQSPGLQSSRSSKIRLLPCCDLKEGQRRRQLTVRLWTPMSMQRLVRTATFTKRDHDHRPRTQKTVSVA